ncbi:MAG: DUF86 domain-containing protein [Candidatus Omnitrophica bacterium]|nr:DUF86 domain-containing protein [Candidatus Omnitrophota bacterium]
MVDAQILAVKLKELEKYIAELEKLRTTSVETLSKDLNKIWSLEHGLQLSIQIVIDIGNHILADMKESNIETYTDVIDLLGVKKVIPVDFAKRIRAMVGLRNILVHEYVEVDLKQLYSVLQNNLDDFKEFAEFIRCFLKK